MVEFKDREKAGDFESLKTRQRYLVTQANDLAKAFGNLTTFQHKILDYCFSFVSEKDSKDKVYSDSLSNLIRHLGLEDSGANYKRVAKDIRTLYNKTLIDLVSKDGNEITLTTLFSYVTISKNGKKGWGFRFKFSELLAPLVFQLEKNYYSFSLSELATFRSKYALILVKLWNANLHGMWGKHNELPVKIKGSLDEWELWLLGTDESGKIKHWTPGRLKQNALKPGLEKLEERYGDQIEFTLYTNKAKSANGSKKTTGFELVITPKTIKNDLDELN